MWIFELGQICERYKEHPKSACFSAYEMEFQMHDIRPVRQLMPIQNNAVKN